MSDDRRSPGWPFRAKLAVALSALLLFASLLAWRARSPASQSASPPSRPAFALSQADVAHLPLTELAGLQPDIPWGEGSPPRLLPVVAELLRRAGSGKITDEEWRAALTSSGVILTRPRWPVGVPLQVGIDGRGWLRASKIAVRAVEPDLGEVSFDDLVPEDCGNCSAAQAVRAQHLRLAGFPAGTTRVVFEVTVLQRTDAEEYQPSSEGSRLLWKGRLERAIQAVPTVADAVSATRSDSDRDRIRRALSARWSGGVRDTDTLCLYVGGRYSQDAALRTLGIALRIELWDGSRSLRTADLVAYASRDILTYRVEGRVGSAFITDLANEFRAPNADSSKWELRVRSNPEEVPGIWEADHWWDGAFSMTLAEALEH